MTHAGHPLLSIDGITTRWCIDEACNRAGLLENPFVPEEEAVVQAG